MYIQLVPCVGVVDKKEVLFAVDWLSVGDVVVKSVALVVDWASVGVVVVKGVINVVDWASVGVESPTTTTPAVVEVAVEVED